MEDIPLKAELGRSRLRGFGTLRPRPLPSLDDLTFIPCSLTRIPLEGYRERCSTTTRLGTRHARRPIELEIPVMMERCAVRAAAEMRASPAAAALGVPACSISATPCRVLSSLV